MINFTMAGAGVSLASRGCRHLENLLAHLLVAPGVALQPATQHTRFTAEQSLRRVKT